MKENNINNKIFFINFYSPFAFFQTSAGTEFSIVLKRLFIFALYNSFTWDGTIITSGLASRSGDCHFVIVILLSGPPTVAFSEAISSGLNMKTLLFVRALLIFFRHFLLTLKSNSLITDDFV